MARSTFLGKSAGCWSAPRPRKRLCARYDSVVPRTQLHCSSCVRRRAATRYMYGGGKIEGAEAFSSSFTIFCFCVFFLRLRRARDPECLIATARAGHSQPVPYVCHRLAQAAQASLVAYRLPWVGLSRHFFRQMTRFLAGSCRR